MERSKSFAVQLAERGTKSERRGDEGSCKERDGELLHKQAYEN